MAEVNLKVNLIPNTKELNKIVSKAREVAFPGGDSKKEKKETNNQKKRDKKRDDILSKVLKSVGIIAIVSTALVGLTDLIRPFVSLFAALSALVFFPLWDALSPVLVDFADFLKRVKAAGGGPAGFVTAAAQPTERQIQAGVPAGELPNLGTALAGALVLAIGVAIAGAAALGIGGATIGAALALVIAGAIIIKAPAIAEGIEEKIGKFWSAVLAAVLIAIPVIILAAMGGWVFALIALLIAAVIVFLPELKRFFTEMGSSIKGIWDSFTSKLGEVLNNLIDKIRGFFSFFTFGGIFGRARGGPVSSGVPFIVGEKGPELFVPNTSGNIIPNNALNPQQPVGGNFTLNINNPVIRSDQDIRKLTDQISRVMAKDKLKGFSPNV